MLVFGCVDLILFRRPRSGPTLEMTLVIDKAKFRFGFGK